MGQIISDVTDVLNYQDDKKKAKSTQQEILTQMSADKMAKQNLVNKVLATQRAKYGASGMKNSGQTEDAVLKRLKNETEEPYKEKMRANINKLKNARAKKKNLLLSVLEHMEKLVK